MYDAGPTYAYSNPFYVEPTTYVEDPGLNYSQPIQVPAPVNVSYGNYVEAPATTTAPAATAAPATATEPESQYGQQAAASPPPAESETATVPPEAVQNFDAARAAFKTQDYAKALTDIDAAIKVLNNDVTMHEFRALVLFAQKKYKDAAAGIYAVLSVGPGWKWETMSSLYAKPDTYTNQLRDLENYQKANMAAPDGHFLLAYHYLVLGHTQQALTQFEKFIKLVPGDKLVPELIKAFTPAPSNKPKAEGQ
jgi:tetratricopeptide (TPR) repeat protein